MAIAEEILSLLSLVFGIVLGDFLTTKAFGRPKRTILFFVEIFLFVVIIIFITRSIFMTEMDLPVLVSLYFITGLISIVLSRGILTGVGYLAVLPKSDVFREYTKEESLIINTAKALSEQGIEKEEIKNIMVSSGFSKRSVDKILGMHKFKTKTNPLVKRLAKLEEEKNILEEKLESLTKREEKPKPKIVKPVVKPIKKRRKRKGKEEYQSVYDRLALHIKILLEGLKNYNKDYKITSLPATISGSELEPYILKSKTKKSKNLSLNTIWKRLLVDIERTNKNLDEFGLSLSDAKSVEIRSMSGIDKIEI